MKALLITFSAGFLAGIVSFFLFEKRTSIAVPVEIKQDKGSEIIVVSNIMTRGVRPKLTTHLTSKDTGNIVITHTLPSQKGVYLRFGVIPSFGSQFGFGALAGMEYRTGRMGYFLDAFYDPLLKQGGFTTGISIKVW